MSGQKESQTPLLSLLGLKLAYLEEMQNLDGFWTALFRGQLRYCIFVIYVCIISTSNIIVLQFVGIKQWPC